MTGDTPRFKLGTLVVSSFIALACGAAQDSQVSAGDSASQGSSAEAQPGWTVLFDGTGTDAWRGFRRQDFPAGWQVVEGALTRVSEGGDIVTKEQFGDFELELDWSVAPGGNSGIMFRVTEADSNTYRTGPEMQVLDDAKHRDGASRLTAAGANYGLHEAPAGVVKPAGDWNHVRLVVRGAHVEHWLNGQKVVQYELWSPDWEAKVKASKFAEWPKYGRAKSGHIAIQGDHDGALALRNIKIRTLP